MSNKTYDEKGMIKPQFLMTDSEKKKIYFTIFEKLKEENLDDNLKIDLRTDFGKGLTFKSVDGKDWATYEDAMIYNEWYYEQLIGQINEDKTKKK